MFDSHCANGNTLDDTKMINDPMYQSMPELLFAKDALWKLIREYDFCSVLDIGAGQGLHSKYFVDNGKKVTTIDDRNYLDNSISNQVEIITADYLNYTLTHKFDLIWASMVLEHQRNIGLFLDKVNNDLVDGGLFAVTVPPNEPLAGGEHITCFTPGHLVYHLLEAGFDLTDLRLKIYHGNMTAICKKNEKIKARKANHTAGLDKFYGQLPDYLIESIENYKKNHVDKHFDGRIAAHERIEQMVKYRW